MDTAGTEDAAAVWQETWTDHVKENGSQMGSASSPLFGGPELLSLCHGDDFLLVTWRSARSDAKTKVGRQGAGQDRDHNAAGA